MCELVCVRSGGEPVTRAEGAPLLVDNARVVIQHEALTHALHACECVVAVGFLKMEEWSLAAEFVNNEMFLGSHQLRA